MDVKIRRMEETDREQVLGMMRVFYRSEAVFSNGSEEIFNRDVDECVHLSPYLEGYVFEKDGQIAGYAMLAKSFSTEFGKPCIWIEDLYLKPEFRGQGIGSAFLVFAEEKYPEAVLRLEAEQENQPAVSVYRKNGYGVLPYLEMIKRSGISL